MNDNGRFISTTFGGHIICIALLNDGTADWTEDCAHEMLEGS